jgi:CubicO group peptidase (beta-lactamase class C family)
MNIRAPGSAALLLSACLGLPACPIMGQATDPATAVGHAEVKALVDGFFESELENTNIPGGVFLMVQGGSVLYMSGYGLADLERGEPIDPRRTVFRVGSNSKTLTAAAVLSLVESGRVGLDTDVNEYLTPLTVPEAFGTPITLRHLLTHTAGFDERLFGQHVTPGKEPMSLGDFIATNLPPRTGAPGRVISYNDFGTSLAGLVVEDVSGKPFAEYVDEHIFGPLGMASSSFAVSNLPPDIRARLATAYRYRGGSYTPYEYDVIQTAPAAGLVTTATDMGRFMSALLGGGESAGARILSDSMTAVMLDRQFVHSPLLRGRAFGFVESDENGIRGVSKDGQATGFLSRIFLLPEANIGFFASINLSIFEPGPSFNRASSFHRRLTTAILDRFFMPDSTFFDLPDAPDADPMFDARPFVGTYRAMEGSRHTIEKILFLGNETAVTDGGDGTIRIGSTPYVHLEDGAFQYAGGGPYYAAFGGFEDGRADHLFIGAGAMERVPWYDTLRTTVLVLGTVTLVLVSALLTWPFAGWLRRRRGTDTAHPGRVVMLSGVCLAVIFIVGFGWFFSQTDFQEFFKGIPTRIAILLALPVAVVPLTVVTVFSSVQAWRTRRGSLAGRVHYSMICGALVALLILLANWHMLGWQY